MSVLQEFSRVHGLDDRQMEQLLNDIALLRAGHALEVELMQEALAAIWWSGLIEPGDGSAGSLIARFGLIDGIHQVARWLRSEALPPLATEHGGDLRAALRRWRPRFDDGAIVQAIRSATSLHARLLLPRDPMWPSRLNDLGVHAPPCLWVVGDVSLLDQARTAAIVGSRAATNYGVEVCAEIVQQLSAQRFVIVSGGAYGIDRQAHHSALAAGGRTIAVLAGGIDRLYPAGNEALLRRIAAEGCLIAEQAPGIAPSRWRFLGRNRIIAALAGVTIVVEAGARSGALNTAHHAAQLGRPLSAVPGSVHSASSVGTNRLIRDGLAQLVTDARDVLSLLTAEPLLQYDEREGLRAELVRLLDALDDRHARTVLHLARLSGLDESTVRAGLAELALLEQARCDDAPDPRWRRTPQQS